MYPYPGAEPPSPHAAPLGSNPSSYPQTPNNAIDGAFSPASTQEGTQYGVQAFATWSTPAQESMQLPQPANPEFPANPLHLDDWFQNVSPSAAHEDHNGQVYSNTDDGALDGADDDDEDMNGHGGAPLVNYMDINNILSSNQDDDFEAPVSNESPVPSESTIPSEAPLPSEAPVSSEPPLPSLDPVLSQIPGDSDAQSDDESIQSHTSIDAMEDESDPVSFYYYHPPLPPHISQLSYAGFMAAHYAGNSDTNSMLPTSDTNFLYAYNVAPPDPHTLHRFLRTWARDHHGHPTPSQVEIFRLCEEKRSSVEFEHLMGDQCDLQGIDWIKLGVTRKRARKTRFEKYRNYVNVPGSDEWEICDERRRRLAKNAHFFSFRRMDIRRDAHLAHFQLRNTLASVSRSQVFYTAQGKVQKLDTYSGNTKTALYFGEPPVNTISITTMAANHGFLFAGGTNGEYRYRRIDAEYVGETPEVHEGVITNHASGITNHVDLVLPRTSSAPHAIICSNDGKLRTLDMATESYLSTVKYQYPINCTATSPDGRLRVVVGDSHEVRIDPAEVEHTDSNSTLNSLRLLANSRRDFGFSCAWAPDGYTLATGFQDRSILIWDARKWRTSSGTPSPLTELRTEMCSARSLKFSPLGSGKRVLAAAEDADFVDIYDAQTFQSKQTIDVFGEIGGMCFVDGGQALHVLCSDPDRGGVLQFERYGTALESMHDEEAIISNPRFAGRGGTFDWPTAMPTPQYQRAADARRRRLRASAMLLPLK